MLGSSCMDTVQQEMLFTLLGLHSFEKIEQSYNYMYERTV